MVAVTPRIGAALRFAITITVVDLVALQVIRAPGAATFASFAVVSALYFLDFDGSWRERLGGYAAATALGLAGICLGTAVAGTLWLAVISAFAVACCFGFARILRGYVARSAVGVQLSFLMCVLTPAVPSELFSYLAAWAMGSAASVAAALVIFPRHHAGLVRRRLAQWCASARDLALALGTDGEVKAMSELDRAREALRGLETGTVVRPGLLSRRMRAMLQMRAEVEQTTRTMAGFVAAGGASRAHTHALSRASAAGFSTAAAAVRAGEDKAGQGGFVLAPVSQARTADAQAAEQWTSDALAAGGSAAVEALERHHPARVLAISSDVMQHLAARSAGSEHGQPELSLGVETSISGVIAGNLTWRSIWLRNAIRTGIAVAASVLVARELGLEHGFWVALAALSVIQVNFSSGGTGRSALRTGAGVVAGITLASLVLWLVPQAWMFIVLLPFAAFFAKWAAVGIPLLGQFAYTPFAVVNLAVLSWPQPFGVVEVRLEDILIGLAVAAAATALVFRRGLDTLIDSVWESARSLARVSLSSASGLLVDAAPDAGRATADRHALQRSIDAFSDAVDASYMSHHQPGDSLRAQSRREAWLFEVLLAGTVFRQFADLGARPAQVPSLVIALRGPAGECAQRVRAAARSETRELEPLPRALISATWAAWWLDHIADGEPV